MPKTIFAYSETLAAVTDTVQIVNSPGKRSFSPLLTKHIGHAVIFEVQCAQIVVDRLGIGEALVHHAVVERDFEGLLLEGARSLLGRCALCDATVGDDCRLLVRFLRDQ